MTIKNLPRTDTPWVRKDTFHTISYKGEFINMHYEDGKEIIQALDRFWASLKAAKRAISIQEAS